MLVLTNIGIRRIVVGMVGVGIVVGMVGVGIVGRRCLSTISWLVTPGLHSAHVHCNHYQDESEDKNNNK